MNTLRKILGALIAVTLRHASQKQPPPPHGDGHYFPQTGLVEPSDIEGVESADLPASTRSELVVAACLWLAAGLAAAFIAVYIVSGNTQLLGLTLGLALMSLSASLIVAGKSVVAQDTLIEERPSLAPGPEVEEVTEIIERAGTGVTRKRLLTASAGAAAAALGAALILPAASLGPWVGDATVQSPWRRGRRLVDENGEPLAAAAIAMGGFVTAFPEGADKEALGSSLIVVHIDPASIQMRRDWAPEGIMAYSKICTHAGCAVAMMRYPLFRGNAPGPALVCPCHYSTFDITHGARVVFGPAGRPLPQLPLLIDANGYLVADGPLSGDVGPSWTGVDRGSA